MRTGILNIFLSNYFIVIKINNDPAPGWRPAVVSVPRQRGSLILLIETYISYTQQKFNIVRSVEKLRVPALA